MKPNPGNTNWSPCFNHSGLAELDFILKSALQENFNCDISDEQWDLASLPVRDGGLGLRKTEELAIPAYLSSVWSTKGLVSAILGGSLVDDRNNPEHAADAIWASKGLAVPDDTEKGFQKAWDAIQVKVVVKKLVEKHGHDTEWMSRFQSCRGAYSGAWLNTLPMEFLGLKLNDEEARIAAALRIGMSVYKEHICVCGERADERGVHGLSCPMGGYRIARHQSINQVVKRAFGSAQIPAVLEPQGICRKDGKRPDGVSMIPWKMGKSLIWDFSCVNPLTKSYTKAAAKSPLAAAKESELEKKRKYTELVKEYMFVPLVVEVFGSWGPSGLRMLIDLGKKIREVRNDDRASLYLMQSLSINLQKGNAACIRGTLKQLDDQCEAEESRY